MYLWRNGYANSTKHTGLGYAALVVFLWVSVAVEYQDGIHGVIVRIGNKHLKLNTIVFPLLAFRKYTRNTTMLIMIMTLIMTSTNLVSRMISFFGLGTGYVTTEIGNAVNVGVVSLLYFALLLLRLIAANRGGYLPSESNDTGNAAYSDDFYTYCIALSLAITVMSLRAAGMSRLNMYLQLVGLPYVSNIMNQIEDQRIAVIIKVVFSVVIWSYSAIALIYRPEWQHIWPYHF